MAQWATLGANREVTEPHGHGLNQGPHINGIKRNFLLVELSRSCRLFYILRRRRGEISQCQTSPIYRWASESAFVPDVWLMWYPRPAAPRETATGPACSGHFQSILCLPWVEGVWGGQSSLQAGSRNGKTAGPLEPIWPSISHLGETNSLGMPCACLKQNNCLVRTESKQPAPASLPNVRALQKKELVWLSPPGLWFRGLSLPEVYLTDSGFCPLPFPFSFLKHSGWWRPQKDESPWTTAPFQHGACCAALLRASSSQPNEPEKERIGLLLGSWLSSPQSW